MLPKYVVFITWTLETHTYSSVKYSIKQEYVKKKRERENLQCTWMVWLIANLIAISAPLLWPYSDSCVKSATCFAEQGPPVRSNCRSDDLCHSDTLFTKNNHGKRVPSTQSHRAFGRVSSPRPNSSHPTISQHTLPRAGISRPTGKCSSMRFGGCYINKCLLNLGHYGSTSATSVAPVIAPKFFRLIELKSFHL